MSTCMEYLPVFCTKQDSEKHLGFVVVVFSPDSNLKGGNTSRWAHDDDDELMLNVLRCQFDILGTSCDRCRSTVQ